MTAFSGFVGGGAGMARVEVQLAERFSESGEFIDDSDSGLAWQVFAGVRQAISDNADITVKYRFFNVDNSMIDTAERGGHGLAVPVAFAARRDHLQLRWRRGTASAASASAASAAASSASAAASAASAGRALQPGAVHRVLRLG